MHPHPPSPPPRKLLKLKSPFLFIYYFIFWKSQIGWLLIRLHLFHIRITLMGQFYWLLIKHIFCCYKCHNVLLILVLHSMIFMPTIMPWHYDVCDIMIVLMQYQSDIRDQYGNCYLVWRKKSSTVLPWIREQPHQVFGRNEKQELS